MNDLAEAGVNLEPIERYFAEKHRAREQSLALTRVIIRQAGNAIRAAHRRDFERARTLLAESAEAAARAQGMLAGMPQLLYSGFMHDALKECAEAALFLALASSQSVPAADDLGLPPEAYLAGLAECVGELRRLALDALRRAEMERATAILAQMDAIYEQLIGIDFPDAVTAGLRHATDGARSILERTRGDVTSATIQNRLERALVRAAVPAAKAGGV